MAQWAIRHRQNQEGGRRDMTELATNAAFPHRVLSQEEWLEARIALLASESVRPLNASLFLP
jgi:hypothetical protein